MLRLGCSGHGPRGRLGSGQREAQGQWDVRCLPEGGAEGSVGLQGDPRAVLWPAVAPHHAWCAPPVISWASARAAPASRGNVSRAHDLARALAVPCKGPTPWKDAPPDTIPAFTPPFDRRLRGPHSPGRRCRGEGGTGQHHGSPGHCGRGSGAPGSGGGREGGPQAAGSSQLRSWGGVLGRAGAAAWAPAGLSAALTESGSVARCGANTHS